MKHLSMCRDKEVLNKTNNSTLTGNKIMRQEVFVCDKCLWGGEAEIKAVSVATMEYRCKKSILPLVSLFFA
jgi:hypothetical protein